MNYYPLFLPMIGMILLTCCVWFYMYALRLRFVFQEKINAQKLRTPEQVATLLPDQINAPSNNLKNLFELPLLFYGIIFIASQIPDHSIVSNLAAWSFLFFRIVHSFIHCGNGKVMFRFIVYILSSLSLFILLGNVIYQLLGVQQ
jgi:hypothetical protein